MLENRKHRSDIQDSGNNGFRKTWAKLFGSFFSNTKNVQGGLQGMGEGTVPGRVDEEILHDIQSLDKIENMDINTQTNESVESSRESQFSSRKFEWIKTERAGDICQFKGFETENGTEYTCFTDGTRIRTDLIGDIVLMHIYEDEILGNELTFRPEIIVDKPSTIIDHLRAEQSVTKIEQPETEKLEVKNVFQDPVVSILDKSKKKVEKLTLTLNVKIPSVELYNVIKENFENTEEILLDSVMEQLHEKLLREAVKREIQNIYSTKKKKG
jgi:hypothetical protein